MGLDGQVKLEEIRRALTLRQKELDLKKEKKKERIKSAVRLTFLGTLIIYSTLNYSQGYLPAKELINQDKTKSQIEEILSERYTPLFSKALSPGRQIAYTLNEN